MDPMMAMIPEKYITKKNNLGNASIFFHNETFGSLEKCPLICDLAKKQGRDGQYFNFYGF